MKITQVKRPSTSFQQPVSESALTSVLKSVLIDEIVLEVNEIASGWFNSTYHVKTSKRSLILKVAPSEESDVFYNERYLMQREESLSPYFKKFGSIIPEYVSFFKIGDRYASIQEYVDGLLWHDVNDELATKDTDRLWNQLGGFTKQLHEIKGDTFGYPSPLKSHAKWSGFILDYITGIRDNCLRNKVHNPLMDVFLDRVKKYYELLDTCTSPSLLHGDIWPRNVIIGNEGESYSIKAVIDSERAYWGDPISEWVLLFFDLPESFWDGYGSNLKEQSDERILSIYKGMYYMLNILESTRFPAPIEPTLKELEKMIDVLGGSSN